MRHTRQSVSPLALSGARRHGGRGAGQVVPQSVVFFQRYSQRCAMNAGVSRPSLFACVFRGSSAAHRHAETR